jgi:hypothetical protein
VTEEQRHDAEQEFILAETRHRMKNLFAVVRAIAMQTKAKTADVVEYRDTFLARLDVALRAQGLATNQETTDLEVLLWNVVGELGTGRLHANGPPVELALALIEREEIDAAILDVHLGDEFVFPVTERHDELDASFVFATSYDPAFIPKEFSRFVLCEKPTELEKIAKALFGSGPSSGMH